MRSRNGFPSTRRGFFADGIHISSFQAGAFIIYKMRKYSLKYRIFFLGPVFLELRGVIQSGKAGCFPESPLGASIPARANGCHDKEMDRNGAFSAGSYVFPGARFLQPFFPHFFNLSHQQRRVPHSMLENPCSRRMQILFILFS